MSALLSSIFFRLVSITKASLRLSVLPAPVCRASSQTDQYLYSFTLSLSVTPSISSDPSPGGPTDIHDGLKSDDYSDDIIPSPSDPSPEGVQPLVIHGVASNSDSDAELDPRVDPRVVLSPDSISPDHHDSEDVQTLYRVIIVGSVNLAAIWARSLDISNSISTFEQFLHDSSIVHVNAAEHLPRYVKGTFNSIPECCYSLYDSSPVSYIAAMMEGQLHLPQSSFSYTPILKEL